MLNFALIGCGRIGRKHAELIPRFGRLKALCDVDVHKAELLASSPDIHVYSDLATLLNSENDISVVVICTPNGLHAAHSIMSLDAGCHVLCEKPMALNADDCRSMMASAEKNNRQLVVVKQNRFNPPVAALKKAIDEGRLGRIFNVQLNCFWNRPASYYENSWHGSADLDGGTLFTQFSHFIDLLPWMIGELKDVSAVTANFMHKGMMDFEDTGVVSLLFQNGAIGSVNFTVNSHSQNMEGSVTVFGEKGVVKVGGRYLNNIEYQDIENYELQTVDSERHQNRYGSYEGSMSNHDLVYENLVSVLTRGESPAAGGEDGLKTVGIIERIYQSAKKYE